MSLRKIVVGATAAILGLALAASTVFAAIGNQNPNLTVQLTLDPTVIIAPATVTGNGSITNNTTKTERVVAKVTIVSPSGVTSTYIEKYVISPGQTVTETVVYEVAADAQKGVYTVTLSATDKAGTSSATEYLTVQ